VEIDYHEIGIRIRNERKRQNLSQERLAEMVRTGITHISHIETGNTVPSMKVFINIVNALDMSADELLRGHITKTKHVFEGEFADIFQSCTKEEARIAADTVKALIASLRSKENA